MNTETNYVGAYRLHVGDLIPFNSSIYLGIEHGGNNEVGCEISCVSYFYKLPGSASALELCAELDVGDSISELVFQYQVQGGSSVVSNTFSYTGDNHDVLISDDGRLLFGASSFVVEIPPVNDGVLIRRRMDSGYGVQQAKVYVDGAYVTDWYVHDDNFSAVTQRWSDCDLYIPYDFTAGKSTISLKVEVSTNYANWNEYGYTVYAVHPLNESGDMDEDGMPDEWEVQFFNNVKTAVFDDDEDGDGFSNGQEYICLTDPRDDQSLFKIETSDSVAGDYSFMIHTVTGRHYEIKYCTNLSDDAWLELAAVPGSGFDFIFSVMDESISSIFFRANVRLE